MPLNQPLIDQINAGQTGTDGKSATSGTPAGTNGGDGIGASETVTGDNFSDPSANLVLDPLLTGGSGGSGQAGASGAPGTSVYTPILNGDGVQIGSTTTYQPGGNGSPGGDGGTAGAATLGYDDDSIGALATPYGGTAAMDGDAVGGAGGSGDFGGGGGNAGYDENADGNQVIGSTAGGGNTGGSGAAGGNANASIGGVTGYMALDGSFSLTASGGAGGNGAQGGGGGIGGSDGQGDGAGGAGGAGGNANATFSGNDLFSDQQLSVNVAAVGGAGGAGGTGGDGGASENASDTPPLQTYRFADNAAGGAGGNAGSTTAVMTGNTLTGDIVEITLAADPAAGGAGGAGGLETFTSTPDYEYIDGTPGAAGTAGDTSTPLIDFSNNIVTVGAGVPGFVETGGTPSELFLSLFIQTHLTSSFTALDGAAGGNLEFSGNRFVGTGNSILYLSLSTDGGATIDAGAGTLRIGGSAANSLTGFTTFNLDSNDTFLDGSAADTVNMGADPDIIVVTPGDGRLTLQGVTAGNLILQFNGFGGALAGTTQVAADTTQADGMTTLDLPGGQVITLDTTAWAASADDTAFNVACFCAGTRIATPGGAVPVEDLCEGDRVLTASGGTRAVRWLGHRSLDCRRHPRPREVWPVRVSAGAFAPEAPRRDLLLSPDHALHIDGFLVPVRCLLNGTTVAQIRVDEVTYFHVELPTHDVIFAEGIAAESYLDTGNRAAFAPTPARVGAERRSEEPAAAAPSMANPR